jgi:hypothetical protein
MFCVPETKINSFCRSIILYYHLSYVANRRFIITYIPKTLDKAKYPVVFHVEAWLLKDKSSLKVTKFIHEDEIY